MMPTYECCKFRGSVVALDGATGKQIWKSFSVVDPPKALAGKNSAGAQLWGPAGAAIWGAPTIDVAKKVIYVGTGNSYTNVAFRAMRRGSTRSTWDLQPVVVQPGAREG